MILFLVRWKCFPSIGVAGGDISRLQLVLSKTPLSKLIRGCEKYLLEKIIQLVAELSEQMPRCRPQERLTIPRSLFMFSGGSETCLCTIQFLRAWIQLVVSRKNGVMGAKDVVLASGMVGWVVDGAILSSNSKTWEKCRRFKFYRGRSFDCSLEVIISEA